MPRSLTLAIVVWLVGASGLIAAEPASPAPSPSPRPLPFPPVGQYLLVEVLHETRPKERIMIDFPAYTLEAKQLTGMVPPLSANDLGFVGHATSMLPPGGGMSSRLEPLKGLPLELVTGARITAMHEDGSLTVEKDGQPTLVGPGKRLPLGDKQGPMGPSTITLANHGFLPRHLLPKDQGPGQGQEIR